MADSPIENPTYARGDIVYLKADSSQTEAVVVGYVDKGGTEPEYLLRIGTNLEFIKMECEITRERDERLRSEYLQIMDDD